MLSALAGNNQLSAYVLWHDSVPAWAAGSTRGAALASLRSAARSRAEQGVRIKLLTDRRQLVLLTINRAGSAATAVVSDSERLQPGNLHGQPLGRPLSLTERGRFVLHRLPGTRRFVVWQVTALR